MSFISPVATDTNGAERKTGSQQVIGKDDFLKLLVTKLQNQDPLNPMEDADFAAQLAQFSSLEQMQNIADGIAESNQWDLLQMQSLNNAMASNLIGREIKANYSTVYVNDASQPKISFTLPEYAQEVVFTIKDVSGNVVTSFTSEKLPAGAQSITWDATDSFGNRVADGAYTIEATALAASGGQLTPELSLTGVVESIVYRSGAAYLRVNGMEIPLGDISAVGEPGTL